MSDPDRKLIEELVEPLRSDPAGAAVLLDIDGTLAPIAGRPEDVEVAAPTVELVRSLNARYGLVACVSGRRAEDARRIVGITELHYAGNHGFERLRPGDEEASPDPALAGATGDASGLVDELGRGRIEAEGLRVEDKGPIQAIHWRGSQSPRRAEAFAERIASRAQAAGLDAHFGRMIIELRPMVDVSKGSAVRALLGGEFHLALYGGDDRTDLDAFAALDALVAEGALGHAVKVGVEAPDGPPELPESADLMVSGPDGFVAVLEALAR
ncbi:MAG: trehalose-phosphatase [Solirubrobacterales bacterium]|nr:trehalose-phosphatase [Solirubrobacterales bacterium]